MIGIVTISVFFLFFLFIALMYGIQKSIKMETVMCPNCGEINQVTEDSKYYQCDCGRIGKV